MNSAMYPDIFDTNTTHYLWKRIESLTTQSVPLWGKMRVDQVLAHCCVSYEQALGLRHDGPNPVMKFILKAFFKKSMVNEVPYKQNLPTAPSFVIIDQRNFEDEKNKLKDLIQQVEKKGRNHFEGKSQLTLGVLSGKEWNNLLFKHIDHHLRQFGA
jgi:hypothetical protein